MPPRTRTVESVRERKVGAADGWEVITRAADGSGLTHLFPKDVLEWRAAEYGIDASDIDTLLDIVLHENFHEEEPQDAPPTPYTAASTAQAREAHLARISKAKATRERITLSAEGGPLDAIRARPGITEQGIRAKREQVDIHRWNKLYGGLPVPVTESKEAIRA